MKKYLLSSGQATERVEYYIIDLFKLYLKIFPGDIPGASGLGFNFNLGDTRQADLPEVVLSRVNQLIKKIQDRFMSGITIALESLELVSETRAKVIIRVNHMKSDEIYINLYNENIT